MKNAKSRFAAWRLYRWPLIKTEINTTFRILEILAFAVLLIPFAAFLYIREFWRYDPMEHHRKLWKHGL